ncbi:SLC13 family permease [Lamprobacter modestohalophilus]|uniref:SLC13 family permease n=1 Tax=Lamprobacter modestohalophilus TaxID=1064514 RepID=UPI001F5BB117|nr:SLC13 family permease [Lamprobacter modestohalophilus]
MSSTWVVTIFVPSVLCMANRSGIAPAQLMMPMAYAALISGMMTLVATSPNLVINYELVRTGTDGFDFFSFTPFGGVLLGLFIVNTANAVLLIPLALAVAEELQASPYPFAMIVALAASAAFMNPISPINTLVTTAGNYRISDFIRIGLPLTLIIMAVSVAMVPWLLPLYPTR